ARVAAAIRAVVVGQGYAADGRGSVVGAEQRDVLQQAGTGAGPAGIVIVAADLRSRLRDAALGVGGGARGLGNLAADDGVLGGLATRSGRALEQATGRVEDEHRSGVGIIEAVVAGRQYGQPVSGTVSRIVGTRGVEPMCLRGAPDEPELVATRRG